MENIRKSYSAGIFVIVLSIIGGLFSSLLNFDFGENVNLIVIIMLSIIGVCIFAFSLKFFKGFYDIGRRHSRTLRKASRGFITLIVIKFLLVCLYILFVVVGGETNLQIIFGIVLILIILGYGILTIVFGLGIKRIRVISDTKNLLSFFSLAEGISFLSIIGLIAYPYFALNSLIFKFLFLDDTFTREHLNKERRNKMWWVVTLVIYVLILMAIAATIIIYIKMNYYPEGLNETINQTLINNVSESINSSLNGSIDINSIKP